MSLQTQKDFLDKLASYENENSQIEGAYLRHNHFSGEIFKSGERLLVEKQTFTKKN